MFSANVLAGRLPLLVVLLGPTASGKTALSLRLAREFKGEVISCDSVAVYKDFEIGTGKPSLEERRQIPHHLIDVVSPLQSYSAGDYSRDARVAIYATAARGRMPIVTGGTGLYLRALLCGLFQGPPRLDSLRTRLRGLEARLGAGHLHRVLQHLDPAAAGDIHGNDIPKLVRAIEVCLAGGRPMTEAWSLSRSEPLTGFRILRLGIGGDAVRKALYHRINERAASMFEQGLVEETQRLLGKYGRELQLFDSLGYRQAAAHLRGEYALETAIRLTQQGHRNYAKRQLTWFRREPDVHWLAGFGDELMVEREAIRLVSEML